jgi:hypothetical protein
MMNRNRRGSRRTSIQIRLAIAAAVLVGGGAAGVAVVATNHGSSQVADSAGYTTSSNQVLSESAAMSSAMNWWNKSQQTSLVVISKMVTIRAISVVTFHDKSLVVERGTVVAKDPGEFVTTAMNGDFEIWHFNNGTKFLNVGNSKTGWNALSGGTMSSQGSWNWSNTTNSKWNPSVKTPAKGDLVFIFGERVHGQLDAQLVLFAAPSKTAPTPFPTQTQTVTPAPTVTVTATPTATVRATPTSGNSHW